MDAKPAKILVIDDDPAVTTLLKAKLDAAGCATTTVNDAATATAAARALKPDLIVCDIDLGDACGGEIAQELGTDRRTGAIPVVFLSSMVSPEDMIKRPGGRKLISKQIKTPEIIERILRELPQRK
jgi:CheY-like chemotaxis protein